MIKSSQFGTHPHYCDVIMCAMASQITCLMTVYSAVYSGADQRKHQSSASLVFVHGIHRWPVNSPHKWPVTRKMFPFDDVIMRCTHALMCLWLLVRVAYNNTFQGYFIGTGETHHCLQYQWRIPEMWVIIPHESLETIDINSKNRENKIMCLSYETKSM